MADKDLKVLVIEDLKVAQIVAFNVFKKLNCQVYIATQAASGLEKIFKVGFDIIFIDIQLPDINGFELARTIRIKEKPSHHTPLIAVTANSSDELENQTKEAGFDDYLIKPLTIENIRHVLQKHIGKIYLKIHSN